MVWDYESIRKGGQMTNDDVKKRLDEIDVLLKRDVSNTERQNLADRGQAMPDGSYPIANVADLKNAIQAFGRAKDKDKVKRHIIRRARALGRTDLLPVDWSGSTKE